MKTRRKIDSRRILKVARSWVGTKFHYAGRIRKNSFNSGGVDCIGLIIEVGKEINSTYDGKNISFYGYLNYSRYPNNSEMKKFFDKYFIKINKKDVKPGDVVYMNFNNNLEHAGILTSGGLIHCYVDARVVVEHKMTSYWYDKIIDYYRYQNT
ncbi:MAG: C40 family peptidase [Rickettsiales bacterium]|nr:C40 family peptidase [Rickettsiales bacterium]